MVDDRAALYMSITCTFKKKFESMVLLCSLSMLVDREITLRKKLFHLSGLDVSRCYWHVEVNEKNSD